MNYFFQAEAGASGVPDANNCAGRDLFVAACSTIVSSTGRAEDRG